jgi:hypothetical protein
MGFAAGDLLVVLLDQMLDARQLNLSSQPTI